MITTHDAKRYCFHALTLKSAFPYPASYFSLIVIPNSIEWVWYWWPATGTVSLPSEGWLLHRGSSGLGYQHFSPPTGYCTN